MRFGSFLLSKKLISKEDFLKAIIQQLQSTPPLLSFLYDHCPHDKIMKILEHQAESSKTLLQIQSENRIFDKTDFQKCLDAQKMSKKPIGQILLDLKAIDVEALDSALSEFQKISQFKASENEDTPQMGLEEEGKEVNNAETATHESLSDEDDISPAALESLRELVEMGSFDPEEYKRLEAKAYKKKTLETSDEQWPNLNRDFLNNFLDYAGQNRVQELLKLLNKIKSSNLDSNEEILDQIESDVKEISGAAKLAKAMISFRVSEKILSQIKSLREGDSHGSNEMFSIYEGLKYLGVISKVISLKQEEKPLLKIDDVYSKIKLYID